MAVLGYDLRIRIMKTDSTVKPASAPTRRLSGSQAGAVSLYVSFVIMVIISLIALTFAKIMSDRYRETAEGQYDLQAHYAAESAINSVRATIHKELAEREQTSGGAIKVTAETHAANPTQQAQSSCNTSGAEYGASIDTNGNKLVVGTPGGGGGFCYRVKNSTVADWAGETDRRVTPVKLPPSANSRFGAAVALSADGNFLAVGAPQDQSPSRGSVYVYKYDGSSWSFETKIVPYPQGAVELGPPPPPELFSIGLTSTVSGFGSALAWDGSKLFVGAPGSNAVYSLTRASDGFWSDNSSQLPVVPTGASSFGLGLSTDAIRYQRGSSTEGTAKLIVRANNGIHLLHQDSTTWLDLCHGSANCGRGGLFSSLDSFVSSSGSQSASLMVLSSVATSPQVNILQRSPPDWPIEYTVGDGGDLDPNDIPALGSTFGSAVALHGGNLLIVGEPGTNTLHYFNLDSNDFIKDLWAAGLDQDCPAQGEEVHPAWSNNQITSLPEIYYTCVSVEVDPQKLIYQHLGQDRSLILPLYAADGEKYEDQNLKTLTIEWNHTDGGNHFRPTATTDFPEVSGWGNQTAPVLRVQITAVNRNQDFSTQLLTNNTRVFFLYPSPDLSGGSIGWPLADDDGQIINGNCGTGSVHPCTVKFDIPAPGDLDGPAAAGDKLVYFVRLQSIYTDAQLTVSGRLRTPAKDASFKNIQAVIAATGWSSQIGQRISERIPLRPIYDLPEYGIDSAETLCKILVTTSFSGVFLDVENRSPLNLSQIGSGDHPCSLKVD